MGMALIVLTNKTYKPPIIVITQSKIESIQQDIDAVSIDFASPVEDLSEDSVIVDVPEQELSVDLEEETTEQPRFEIPSNLSEEIDLPENNVSDIAESEQNIRPIQRPVNNEASPESESQSPTKRFKSFLNAGSEFANVDGGTGSFERRLKSYGAKTGDVQISLMWDTADDIDLHVEHYSVGSSERIGWDNRVGYSGGMLDIDMNAAGPQNNQPIENVFWPKGSNPRGEFVVGIHFYRSWTGRRTLPVTLRVQTNKGVTKKQYQISLVNPITPVFRFSN